MIISRSFVKASLAFRASLPELPHQPYDRYLTSLGLSEYNAQLLINEKPLSDYFEQGLAKCKNPQGLCNWITVEFVGRLKETGKNLLHISLPAEHISFLVNLIEDKVITGKIAKLGSVPKRLATAGYKRFSPYLHSSGRSSRILYLSV